MIGTMFGPYRVEALIGRGGMGEVYRAVDTGHGDRVVALKVLAAAVSADPQFVARFRREAEAAAHVDAPHLVPVHRYGAIDGRLFLDMQLVAGRELADVVAADGPLTPERAVAVVEQVAAALDAAHAAGLVHRDVKPGNVMLTDPGAGRAEFAYLLDFGIASLVEPGSRTAVTRTGTIIGTLAYMAPERFLAQPTGPAADIYALACVLHELLSGQRPYPGSDHEAQIDGHLRRPPPVPSAVRPGLPAGFDDVVAWGMAKVPETRPPTAGTLAAAARAVLSTGRSAAAHQHRTAVSTTPFGPAPFAAAAPTLGSPAPVATLPAPGSPTPRRQRLWWIGGGLAAALTAAAVVITAILTTTPVAPPPAPVPAATSTEARPALTERTLVGHVGSTVSTPTVTTLDGRAVLVICEVARPIVVIDLATGEPIGKPIASNLIASATTAMIDGRAVVVTGGADAVIRLWDLDTGEALPTAMAGHGGLVTEVATAEVDGRAVLVSSATDKTVRRWDLRTGRPIGEPITGPDDYVNALTVTTAAGRPAVMGSGSGFQIRTWDLASGAPVGSAIPSRTLRPVAVALPGRGTAVFATENGAYTLRDAASGTVLERAATDHPRDILPVVVNGRLLRAETRDGEIQLFDVASGTPVGSTMTGHEGDVSTMTTVEHSGSTFLISMSATDRSVRIWNLTTRGRG